MVGVEFGARIKGHIVGDIREGWLECGGFVYYHGPRVN